MYFIRIFVRASLPAAILWHCAIMQADEPQAGKSSAAESKPATAPKPPPRVWSKFEPEGAGFSIDLPGTPEESPTTLDTPTGKVYVRVYSVNDAVRERIFTAVVNRFPGAPKPADRKLTLDKARDGALSASKAKLLEEREATHGDYPERRWTMQREDTFLHARVVLADERLYQASIVSSSAMLDDGDRRMLDSLRVYKAVIVDPPPKFDWRYVTPESEKYAVELPGDPQEATQKLATPVGKINMRLMAWGPPGAAEPRYILTVSDLPPTLTADDDRRRLDAARDMLLSQDGIKLVSESAAKIAGRDGRKLVVANAKQTFHLRLLLVENRLFQLAAVGEAEPTVADERFLNSLKLPGM